MIGKYLLNLTQINKSGKWEITMREALAHAKGRLALKTMKVPAKARSMSPMVIAQLRRKLKASTPAFVNTRNQH